MAISMTCPSCGHRYNLADTMKGKTVRCKECEGSFTVPGDREEGVVTADAQRQRRTMPSDDDDEGLSRRRARRRDEDDDEPPPRRRRKKAGPNWLVLGLCIGGGVLVLGGVVVLVVALGGSKFTPEKFKQVKGGMSEKEVIDLLGSPDSTEGAIGGSGNAKTLVWKHKKSVYTVLINNGKVVLTGGFGFDVKIDPPKKPDWSRLQIGMTEQQVRDLFGTPAQAHDYQDIHVIHANVTVEEVTGPDGRTRPVRVLTYFGDPGGPFIDVTFVDGKVYRVKR